MDQPRLKWALSGHNLLLKCGWLLAKVDDIDSALDSKGQMWGISSCYLMIAGWFNSSSTASVTSSVYDYIEENGRRYHRFKAGSKYPTTTRHAQCWPPTAYMLPNDEVRPVDNACRTYPGLQRISSLNKIDWISSIIYLCWPWRAHCIWLQLTTSPCTMSWTLQLGLEYGPLNLPVLFHQ